MTASFADLSNSAKELLRRLQRGQRLLTEQRQLWLDGDPQAASDEQFSDALARWDALERVFRCTKYTACIWGPGRSCPEDAPGLCDGCVAGAGAAPVVERRLF